MWQDVRVAARALSKSPGFTFVAVAALSLGIGFNTTIFSTVNTVLLHPAGIDDASRVVAAETYDPRTNFGWGMSGPDYADILEQDNLFSAAALSGYREFNWVPAGGGTATRLTASRVTHAYFDVFGAKPLLGRVFDKVHDTPGNHRAAVLTYAAWHRLFGGERGVVGRMLDLTTNPTR
jgi:hypothetical protein